MAIEAVGNVYQFEDENGVPYAGGSLTFVIVSTSTAQSVFSDPALSVSLGNIVTLNAAGRTSTSSTGPDTAVYFQQKTYDYTLKNASGTVIYGPITVSGSQWPGQIQGQAILSPAANANGYTNRFTTTINKAVSGTHALFAGTRFDIPTIGAAASTLTEADTVYIEGAPAVGTNKYALHVAAGNTKLDGDLTVSGTFIGGSYTNHGVIVGQGASPLIAITPGTTGQVLAGVTGADPSFQSAANIGASMTLLHQGSGTSTAAGATTVDSFAIAAGTLTVKDSLMVYYTVESVTADTALTFLYNVTDAVALTPLCNVGGVVTAGSTFVGTATVMPRQAGALAIVSQSQSWNTLAATPASAGLRTAFTTALTAAWSLGVRHNGVTATGTFAFTWSVYRVSGQ